MEFTWLNSLVVDKTIEVVLVFNEKGEILFGNKSAEEKLGYSEGEWKTCNMTQIFRQEFQKPDGGYFTFEKEKLLDVKETAMYRKNSSCFSVNIRFFAMESEGVFYLIAEDVTGQKDTDVRIRKLKEEGEINRRVRNEFTANITHELRTPVNGIRGHVSELMELMTDEKQKKTLEFILYCCDNMSSIINNILDFSKLEADKFLMDEKEFDFYKMMDKVIATHIVAINKKELHLRVDVDENIPQFLIGDELRLSQVLNNLLSNAVKFTTVGYVDVTVSKTMQVNDEVELFFRVKDSGIGISKEEQDRLFQSFSQVDATITRRFGGTGLGLAITKQLVEMMHGNIHVESEKGKGSAFSFYVKLHTNRNENENSEQSEVYKKWSKFTKEEAEKNEGGERFFDFGEADNKAELKKRMDKLVLSIELGAWDKAETLSSVIKSLVDKGDDSLKKLVFRMEMAIRKENYEKSMDMYAQVKQALTERLGDW